MNNQNNTQTTNTQPVQTSVTNPNQSNTAQPTQPVQTNVPNTNQATNPTPTSTVVQNPQQNVSTVMNEKPSSGDPKGLILFAVIAILGLGLFYFLDESSKDKGINNDTKKPTITATPASTSTPSGIVETMKMDTFKETAFSAIQGVKQKLVLANRLEEDGDYYFTSGLLENGGNISVLGGNYVYQDISSCEDKVDEVVCKAKETLTCDDSKASFVRIFKENGYNVYSICYTAGVGNKYIDVTNGTERNLYEKNNYSMIK